MSRRKHNQPPASYTWYERIAWRVGRAAAEGFLRTIQRYL
jgi:hypothetical protein